jgi:hypothetical protein
MAAPQAHPNEYANPRLASRAIVAAACVWVLVVLVQRVGFVPIWDGRVYGHCIAQAASNPSLGALRCAGHASLVYVALAAALQAISPDSAPLMLLGNTLLWLAAVAAFARLTRLVFRAADLEIDRALLTAVFAVQPAMIAATLQPSLDLPLVPAFLWSAVFLLERKPAGLVATGMALCFTKETGVLLYATLLGTFVLWAVLGRKQPLAATAKFAAVAAIPGYVFASYLLVRWMGATPTEQVVWNTSTTGDSLWKQFFIPNLDLHLIKYIALMFVLSFAWIPGLILLADGFVGAVHAAHRQPGRAIAGVDAGAGGLLALVTLTALYALTRFTTFGHVRYFLVAFPLIAIVTLRSLVRLQVPGPARRVTLAAFALLLSVSAVRTIDPVSRALYGTFSFGSHAMLRLTALTGECCGYGQDQLAYSAEFTPLQTLVDSAITTMPGPDRYVVVVPDSTVWMFHAPPRGWPIVRGTRHMVMDVPAIGHEDIVNGGLRPDRVYYIATPNGDNAQALRLLSALYDVADERRLQHDGYALTTYRLTLKRRPEP